MTLTKYAANDAADTLAAIRRLLNPDYGDYSEEQREKMRLKHRLREVVQPPPPKTPKEEEKVVDNTGRGCKSRFRAAPKGTIGRKTN